MLVKELLEQLKYSERNLEVLIRPDRGNFLLSPIRVNEDFAEINKIGYEELSEKGEDNSRKVIVIETL